MWNILRIVEAVLTKPQPVFSTGQIIIPGLVPAAYAAGDAMGVQWKQAVPKSGILQSAALWDLSDLNLQVNLTIASAPFFTQIADNAAFALADIDALMVVYQVDFTVFTDWINNRASFIDQIGKPLKFPTGFMYLQAFAVAAQTVAANSIPVVQLDFLPDE